MKKCSNLYAVRIAVSVLLFLIFFCSKSFSSKAESGVLTIRESEIKGFLEKKANTNEHGGYCLGWANEQFKRMSEVYARQAPASCYDGCCANTVGDNLPLSRTDDIPIGALVFFGGPENQPKCGTCDRPCGHAGIYMGNGTFISIRGNGKITLDRISLWEGRGYGYPYKGWITPKNVDIIRDITRPQPTISNPRVVNINENGFDIAFDLKDASGVTDLQCVCDLMIYINREEVSWGSTYLDEIPIWNNKWSINGNTAYAHFIFVDELTPVIEYINGNPAQMLASPYGEVPRVGIDRGPYIVDAQLNYKIPGNSNTYSYTLDFKNSPILINLNSQTKNPVEGQETTEKNNGNNKPDNSPVGEAGHDKDPNGSSGSGGGHSFGKPQTAPVVKTPRRKRVGETFNTAYKNFKVVGNSEIYLTGVTRKDKKVTVPNEMVIEGFTYRVTGISPKAFKDNKTITEITIGEHVEVIGKTAFQNCKKLKTIKIRARNLKQTYKNSFSGTHKDMSVWVRYKDRLKKYKKLISKSGVSKNTKYSYKKF